jgi:hypothetical protein
MEEMTGYMARMGLLGERVVTALDCIGYLPTDGGTTKNPRREHLGRGLFARREQDTRLKLISLPSTH